VGGGSRVLGCNNCRKKKKQVGSMCSGGDMAELLLGEIRAHLQLTFTKRIFGGGPKRMSRKKQRGKKRRRK